MLTSLRAGISNRYAPFISLAVPWSVLRICTETLGKTFCSVSNTIPRTVAVCAKTKLGRRQRIKSQLVALFCWNMGILKFFSIKSTFKSSTISYIINNNDFKIVFRILYDAISKIISQAIVFIFILHQDKLSIYRGAI